MLVDYLERGVLAGVIAGLAYGLYMALVANPLLGYMETVAEGSEHGDHASAGEHAHAAGEHAHEAGEHAHAVSEATTAAVSIGSGVLWGILLGGASRSPSTSSSRRCPVAGESRPTCSPEPAFSPFPSPRGWCCRRRRRVPNRRSIPRSGAPSTRA